MAEIIRGKITDPLYMITNTNEQTMQFRLNGDEILVFPKALEANKQRLEKAFRTDKTISIKITEGATYRIFRGFAEDPVKARKAQFRKAYGLVRLLSRYAVALNVLEESWDTGTSEAFRALNNIHFEIEKQLYSLPHAHKAELVWMNANTENDPYDGKTWLYSRDFQVYLRHDNVNEIPF